MLYNITDALLFSFPFPLSPSSIEYFHYCKHVLHLSLYMIMLVLCICLSLDLSSIYERKLVAFVFLILDTSLNVMSSNCIHLPSKHMSLFLMAE
jgi:hypothetical protein